MHFHLPKPLHGWREFAGEVGIIVLGVLIALGAEQIAETIHWRFETRKLRESLHLEINDDQQDMIYTLMISACVRQRIQKLNQELAAAGTAWQGDPMIDQENLRWAALPMAVKVPWQFYTSGHWQTALSSGALAHMPEAERNEYSYVYRAIEDLQSYAEQEDRIAARLQPLAMDQQLDAQQRMTFESELASLDRLNMMLTIYSRKFIEGTTRGGIAPRNHDIVVQFRRARRQYGDCATPLGSTSESLKAGAFVAASKT